MRLLRELPIDKEKDHMCPETYAIARKPLYVVRLNCNVIYSWRCLREQALIGKQNFT